MTVPAPAGSGCLILVVDDNELNRDLLSRRLRKGGHRVEVANAGARLMLAPDWQPVVWNEAERKKGQAWGLKTIDTFHTHGTPTMEHYKEPVIASKAATVK